MSTGWGGGSWGGSPWGSGGMGSFDFVEAIAWRENVIRLRFTLNVYFSAFLDPPDASKISHYAVNAVANTFDANGIATRTVRPVRARLAQEIDGVLEGDVGRIVDLDLDRPMSSWPSHYTVTVTDLYTEDLVNIIANASEDVLATFKELVLPSFDSMTPTRDIANPQDLFTAEGLPDALSTAVPLGTYRYGDDGDYAIDEGRQCWKKRILRRIVTRKNGFAHLPGYGVGLLQRSKQLARTREQAAIVTDTIAQVRREPETADVSARFVQDQQNPGLFRFQVIATPKAGQAVRLNIPVPT